MMKWTNLSTVRVLQQAIYADIWSRVGWMAQRVFWYVSSQGNRDNIDGMAAGSAKVLQQVLRLVDAHDLYGSVAYPKKHTQADISDIYRLPFATRGVFTNVALQEPFGLTVIEVRCATAGSLR